ncbi:MAG: flagellar protein export ATPase FliI [Bacillota bacterium]|nr:flagellar protein export ATPase FliI [Bacillota bacterium]
MNKLTDMKKRIESVQPIEKSGRITQLIGLTIKARGPRVCLGELCSVTTAKGQELILEAVGFNQEECLFMPLGETTDLAPGCVVKALNQQLSVNASNELLGRVLNGLGEPIDGLGPINGKPFPIQQNAPNPLQRENISEALSVGVKVIDGALTCGKGQRLGIFAGSGVGKSTLLGMMAKNTKADINVIGLIGERGREVKKFMEEELGEEGLKKSVVVVATSDQPPLIRIKAAFVTTAIAEYFCNQGKDVLLMMDSLTRFAMAQREIGLAIGEPPATKGYTPSVFSMLPRLLERAGNFTKGSITGFYTVLVEGDDTSEPVTDAARGILDGHIMLSRQVAAQNHYPAVDVLNSVSRVMDDIVSDQHKLAAQRLKKTLANYYQSKDLIDIGAYKKGSNKEIDFALKYIAKCNEFLQQSVSEAYSYEETATQLLELFEDVK